MTIKLRSLLFGSLIMFGAASAQTNQYLTVSSGYNQDVIANGIGSAASSSTIGVDNAGYAYMSTDYQTTATSPTYSSAIPSSGLVTSAANNAIRFQFAPFSGNNSLRIQQTAGTGTLEFSNQILAAKLYVAATGGSGPVTMTTVVNFTDGSSQTVTGGVIPDWYSSNALPIILSGIGRVSRNDNGVQNDFGNPRIYMYTINIDTANQAKLVSSVQFTKTSAAEGTLNVFAVTAEEAVIPCTTPAAPTANAQQFCGATTINQLSASGAVTGGTYKWYTTATGGNAITATTQLETGTYYVSQLDRACESTRVPVQITVNITPQAEGPTEQTVCPGTLINELAAEPVTDGTLTWRLNGQVVADTAEAVSGVYEVVQTYNDCVGTSKYITVTIGVPAGPVAPAEQTLCNGSLVGDLDATTAEGATVNYSFVGFIVQPVAATANLISGRYSVSQTINGCTSASTYITVTVVDGVSEPTGADTQVFTAGQTIADLDAGTTEGYSVTWYVLNEESTFETVPATTVLENGVTYFVTQSAGSCVSAYHAITATTTASFQNNALNSLKVFPNPATNVITVNNSDVISQISISNLLGQTVINQKANAASTQVNVAALPAGTYILQVQTANGTATAKVVKQ